MHNKEELIHIANILGAHLGPSTEVVVHDFSKDPDHSIIHIVNGHISGRKVGDGLNKLFIRYVHLADHGASKIRYTTHTTDGKVIRSSSANFFDENGCITASLCINQDITNIVALENSIKGLSREQYFETPLASDMDSDGDNFMQPVSIQSLMDGIITDGISSLGTSPNKMNKEAKIKLLRFLDKRGVFLIQKSGQKVCQILGISKFTLYNYLDEVRAEKNK